MEGTSEKLLEVLERICDKFGIVMDEDIYSLSQLAQNLTEQIAVFTIVKYAILLVLALIVIGICFKIFNSRNKEEKFLDRVKNIAEYFLKEESVLKTKMSKLKSFKVDNYIFETVIMFIALMVMFPFIFNSIDYFLEIVKVIISPDMAVVDYFMNYYLY